MTAIESNAPPGPLADVLNILPGLALTGAIAGVAFAARLIPGLSIFSPMILAIVIGISLHNVVGTPHIAYPGVVFSLRRLLRIAIVMLGFQLTFAQVREVGGVGIAVIAATLVATFLFTVWLGSLLGVERRLAMLIGAGTSICGASAVIAANTAVGAEDEDVAYAVAGVTIFGSIAMFVYPVLPDLLGLTPKAYGLWAGASIHEIAQVVAAAFQDGRQAGEFGTIAKLSRVILLAPMVLTLGAALSRKSGVRGARAPVPWFVLGFVAIVALNSVMPLSLAIKPAVVTVTTFLLSMALAAMGLQTDFAKLRAKGAGPMLLGLGSSIFISVFALALVKLAM